MIRIINLEKVSLEELTACFNLCWQNVPVKLHPPYFTVEHLQAYITINCISLRHSLGLTVNQRLAGFSFLGNIAKRGWLASLGIIPDFRGRGLSKLLLKHQLLVCDSLNLLCTTLEVEEDSFMAAVYQSFGFQFYRRLANFVLPPHSLLKKDGYLSPAVKCRKTAAKQYFEARNTLGIPFAWRRQEQILSNYHGVDFYLSPDHASGYSLQNHNKILLDIWSRSREASCNVLLSVSDHGDPLPINNQIQDNIYQLLLENGIQPVHFYAEMIRTVPDR